METFSTQGIPIARKLAFWNELASDAFAMIIGALLSAQIWTIGNGNPVLTGRKDDRAYSLNDLI